MDENTEIGVYCPHCDYRNTRPFGILRTTTAIRCANCPEIVILQGTRAGRRLLEVDRAKALLMQALARVAAEEGDRSSLKIEPEVRKEAVQLPAPPKEVQEMTTRLDDWAISLSNADKSGASKLDDAW